MKNNRTNWMIEFDYDADPETSRQAVIEKLNKELAAVGKTLSNNMIQCGSDIALNLRLRFSDNIRKISRI